MRIASIFLLLLYATLFHCRIGMLIFVTKQKSTDRQNTSYARIRSRKSVNFTKTCMKYPSMLFQILLIIIHIVISKGQDSSVYGTNMDMNSHRSTKRCHEWQFQCQNGECIAQVQLFQIVNFILKISSMTFVMVLNNVLMDQMRKSAIIGELVRNYVHKLGFIAEDVVSYNLLM